MEITKKKPYTLQQVRDQYKPPKLDIPAWDCIYTSKDVPIIGPSYFKEESCNKNNNINNT